MKKQHELILKSKINEMLKTFEKNSAVIEGFTKHKKISLSPHDIDRDRGKPLSLYEKNVIIYDWLYNVDDM